MKRLRSILGLSPRGAAPEAPLTQDAARAENRFYKRFPTGCRFQICWRDERGKTQSKNVKVLDMSGDGALIQSAIPLDPGSIIYLQTRDLGLMGSAYVRRCESLLFSYEIGLEFAGNLSQRI
jgi:hypothetical protein